MVTASEKNKLDIDIKHLQTKVKHFVGSLAGSVLACESEKTEEAVVSCRHKQHAHLKKHLK